MKKTVLLCALAIGLSSASFAADIYVTTIGKTFTKVILPSGIETWQSPNGLKWGQILPEDYTNFPYTSQDQDGKKILNSDAVKACASLGGRLPSLKDYQSLHVNFALDTESRGSVFEELSNEGMHDLYTLFPSMNGKESTWTDTITNGSEGTIAAAFAIHVVQGSWDLQGVVSEYMSARTNFTTSVQCIFK